MKRRKLDADPEQFTAANGWERCEPYEPIGIDVSAANQLYTCLDSALHSLLALPPNEELSETFRDVITQQFELFARYERDCITYPLLSVDQCENLLKTGERLRLLARRNDGAKFLLSIVALCREPWFISAELGASAVCVVGNSGERPATPAKAMQRLTFNVEFIRRQCLYVI